MRNADSVNRTHALYYAATLLFVVLDYVFNINLRAAFLEQHDVARAFYYLFLFVCLALALRFPDKAVYVGTLESGLTVAALIISFWARLLIPGDTLEETVEGWVTIPEVFNFLISGFYGYFAYMSGIRKIKYAKRREL